MLIDLQESALAREFREMKDTLTGSFSRRMFHHRFPEEIQRSLRYNIPLTLLILDIDHFKSINDAFGHSRGDEILADFIEFLKNQLRFTDLVFRYGGDEFIVLMLETSRDEAGPVAERLVESIRDHVFPGKPDISLTLSIGLAECPSDAADSRNLFEKADSRLLEAKFRGRNQLVMDSNHREMALPFEEVSRIVERDAAQFTVKEFLSGIVRKHRGTLTVQGPQGSGKSRILQEAANTAALMNFTILALHGNPHLRPHAFSTMATADKEWDELLNGAETAADYTTLIADRLSGENGPGLFVTVDNTDHLDRASRDLLRQLMKSPVIPVMGIITDEGVADTLIPAAEEIPLREIIELGPLSIDGLKIWLRLLLQWDPPHKFTGWLLRETRGLPAYVKRGLLHLVKRNVLRQVRNGGWTLTPDFQNTPLGQRIGLDTSPPPCNLPENLDRFVGRREEIIAVSEMLDSHRLITLMGPGGIGKTRLAIQVASEKYMAFEHGTFFAALAALSSPDYILSTIADAISFRFQGSADIKTQLMDYLRDKEMLIIMDNVESVIEGREIMADIVMECPEVRLICTSRERLNLHGETITTISGMTFPTISEGSDLHEFSALKLFEQTARSAEPGFQINDENLPDIIRICSLVQGIPLGIILAAPWVRLLSCHEIADEIKSTLDFLQTDQPNIPDRHRSLRSVFQYSWTLLSPDEQRIFAQLSVFHDGFTRDAAAKVTGASLHHLSSLLDKSLIYRWKPSRYFVLDVLRQLAEEKLAKDPDHFIAIKDAHSRFYSARAQELAKDVVEHREKTMIEIMSCEIRNMQDGWQHAVSRRDYESLTGFLSAVYFYFEFTCLYDEGESMLGLACRELDTLQEANPEQDRKRRVILADCYDRRGSVAFYAAKYESAHEFYQKGLGLFESLDMPHQAAMAMNGLGTVAMRRSDYSTAQELLDQALDRIRKDGDPRSRMIVMNNLANVALTQGNFEKARQNYENALTIARDRNERRAQSVMIANLALVYGNLGEMETKKKYIQESIEIRKEMGDRIGGASSLDNLANVEFFLGNLNESDRLHRKALKLRKESGDQWGVTLSLINMAVESVPLEQYDEGLALLTDCIDRCRKLGNRAELAYALAIQGHLLNLTGKPEEAVKVLEESYELSRDLKFHLGMVWAILNMGYVAHEQNRIDESRSHFIKALEIAVNMGMIPIQEEILTGLAEMLAEVDVPDRILAGEILTYLDQSRPLSYFARKTVETTLENLRSGQKEGFPLPDDTSGQPTELPEFSRWILDRERSV